MTLAPGIEAQTFAALEPSYDAAAVALLVTHALPCRAMKIEPDHKWEKSKEHLGSASLSGEIESSRAGKWSTEHDVKTNGAGVLPPIDVLLRMAFGAAPTVTAGTSVVYQLGAGLFSGQLIRHVPGALYEIATGCSVDQVEISFQGTGIPGISFSGTYARHGWVHGGALTTATVAAGATTFTLDATSIGKVGENARVQIGTDTNGGLGYLVVTSDLETGVVTFSPALANAQTGATLIAGFTPTAAYTGMSRGSLASSLIVDGGNYGVISGKTTWKTGLHVLDKEANTARPTGISRGEREISAELTAYYRTEQLARYQGKAWSGTTSNVIQRIGPATAGRHISVETPAIQFKVSPIEVPEFEASIIKLAGLAHRAAASDDELVLRYG